MQQIKTIDRQFYRALGEQIRKRRTHLDMTLFELAQATGYSRPMIDHWELGLNKIKPHQFEKICEALNVSSNIKIDVTIGFWE